MSKKKRERVRTEADLKINDLSEFSAEFQNESDRAAAILAGALLDEWLRSLLAAFFIDSPEDVELLLDLERPMGHSVRKSVPLIASGSWIKNCMTS
jgi:hypothetical protein